MEVEIESPDSNERLGDVIKQAGPVQAFHFDHGGDLRRLIVEMHLGL